MLKRMSNGAALQRATAFYPARLVLAVILAFIAYQSARVAISDLSVQKLEAGMEQIQKSGGGDIPALLAATRALQDYPFKGAFAAKRADAYSLVRYTRVRNNQALDAALQSNPALEEYRHALRIRARDGYLWARYGLHLSNLDPSHYRQEALTAMDQAVALSPRDYNTMRAVADLGVRYWHLLDCNQRTNLLTVLERAASVDDQLLNQWITQLGQRPMAGFLNTLYARYKFNPRWAKASVSACQGETDG